MALSNSPFGKNNINQMRQALQQAQDALRQQQTIYYQRMGKNGPDRGTSTKAHSDTSNRTNSINSTVTTRQSVTVQSISFWPICPSPKPTFENAGIRTGEIIGYRAWMIGRMADQREDSFSPLHLISVAVPHQWEHGQYLSPNGVDDGSKGFHAHKTPSRVRQEYPVRYIHLMGYPDVRSLGMVYGEIKLWGTVYEHTDGYRGEYARVHRITEIYLKDDVSSFRNVILKELKERYKCEVGHEPEPQIIVDSATWTGRKS